MTEIIEKCESLIRHGKDSEAAALLNSLRVSKIERKFLFPIGNLCRRLSLIQLGLRTLTPIVRPDRNSRLEPASEKEVAEYAILLQRAGSVDEAAKLLSQLSPQQNPMVLLYQSFCYFNTWRYQEALPLLRSFHLTAPTDYQKLIAKVNIGATYVAINDFPSAIESLEECIDICRKEKHERLLGNCLELLAQTFLIQRKPDQALPHLEKAEKLFDNFLSLDSLYVRKCRAFYEAQKQKSIEPLEQFKQQASKIHHWESTREADLFSLLVDYSPERHKHLHFGTPFPSYRLRAEEMLGHSVDQQTYYRGQGNLSVDIEGGVTNFNVRIQKGSKNHQLLDVLSRDFYKPQRVNDLFSSLFPDEYFNIFSSPGRIHQSIRRCRKWIEKSGLPVSIGQDQGSYYLQLEPEAKIKVSLREQALTPYNLRLNEIRKQAEGQWLSRSDLENLLRLSNSATLRFVREATEKQDLDVYGAGPNTRYFVKRKENLAKTA